jgi:hypothetical protein
MSAITTTTCATSNLTSLEFDADAMGAIAVPEGFELPNAGDDFYDVSTALQSTYSDQVNIHMWVHEEADSLFICVYDRPSATEKWYRSAIPSSLS